MHVTSNLVFLFINFQTQLLKWTGQLDLTFSQKHIEAKAKLVRSTTKLSHPSAATTTTAKEAKFEDQKATTLSKPRLQI